MVIFVSFFPKQVLLDFCKRLNVLRPQIGCFRQTFNVTQVPELSRTKGPFQIHYTSQLWIEPIPTGKIWQNVKFAAFLCVFLTKKKVDPESWCNKLSIKQLRKKKLPKDNFT